MGRADANNNPLNRKGKITQDLKELGAYGHDNQGHIKFTDKVGGGAAGFLLLHKKITEVQNYKGYPFNGQKADTPIKLGSVWTWTVKDRAHYSRAIAEAAHGDESAINKPIDFNDVSMMARVYRAMEQNEDHRQRKLSDQELAVAMTKGYQKIGVELDQELALNAAQGAQGIKASDSVDVLRERYNTLVEGGVIKPEGGFDPAKASAKEVKEQVDKGTQEVEKKAHGAASDPANKEAADEIKKLLEKQAKDGKLSEEEQKKLEALKEQLMKGQGLNPANKDVGDLFLAALAQMFGIQLPQLNMDAPSSYAHPERYSYPKGPPSSSHGRGSGVHERQSPGARQAPGAKAVPGGAQRVAHGQDRYAGVTSSGRSDIDTSPLANNYNALDAGAAKEILVKAYTEAGNAANADRLSSRAVKHIYGDGKKDIGIHPELRPLAMQFLTTAIKNGFEDIMVTDGHRSAQEQERHLRNGNTTTRYSRHLNGFAIDVGKDKTLNYSAGDWKKLGQIGEKVGFEWGGRWKSFHDPYHFQIPSSVVSHSENRQRIQTKGHTGHGPLTKDEVQWLRDRVQKNTELGALDTQKLQKKTQATVTTEHATLWNAAKTISGLSKNVTPTMSQVATTATVSSGVTTNLAALGVTSEEEEEKKNKSHGADNRDNIAAAATTFKFAGVSGGRSGKKSNTSLPKKAPDPDKSATVSA